MNFLIKTNILISILINLVHSNPTDKSNQTKLVEELEKEKNDLYQKINEAIDESVKLFKTTNDSDALMNIQQMEILKERVRDLNEYKIQVRRRLGGNDTNVLTQEIEADKQTKKDQFKNRAVLSSSNEAVNNDKRKHVKKRLKEGFDFLAINLDDFGMQKAKKKEDKENEEMEHRLEVQKKLDRWIELQELQKIRKKEEKKRLKKLNNEKCPRFGTKGKGKYPCCRKCCKQSYLGCL